MSCACVVSSMKLLIRNFSSLELESSLTLKVRPIQRRQFTITAKYASASSPSMDANETSKSNGFQEKPVRHLSGNEPRSIPAAAVIHVADHTDESIDSHRRGGNFSTDEEPEQGPYIKLEPSSPTESSHGHAQDSAKPLKVRRPGAQERAEKGLKIHYSANPNWSVFDNQNTRSKTRGNIRDYEFGPGSRIRSRFEEDIDNQTSPASRPPKLRKRNNYQPYQPPESRGPRGQHEERDYESLPGGRIRSRFEEDIDNQTSPPTRPPKLRKRNNYQPYQPPESREPRGQHEPHIPYKPYKPFVSDYVAKEPEPWQIQKAALKAKFGDQSWNPRKRISPDAMAGIRALNAQFPDQYNTATLASQFQISPEAVRRILKSKWRPNKDEEEDRMKRWFNRGKRAWERFSELGLHPPKKWRILGVDRKDGETPLWQRKKGIKPKSKGAAGTKGSGIIVRRDVQTSKAEENFEGHGIDVGSGGVPGWL